MAATFTERLPTQASSLSGHRSEIDGLRALAVIPVILFHLGVKEVSGGFVGVAVAWLIAIIVRSTTPMPMALPWSSLLLGVGLSAMVGLFFGIYPARRAAKLDPIEALRAER